MITVSAPFSRALTTAAPPVVLICMSPPINARVTGCPPENWITSRFLMPYLSKVRPSSAAQSGAWVALKIVPARSGVPWANATPFKRPSSKTPSRRTMYIGQNALLIDDLTPFFSHLVFQLLAGLGHRWKLMTTVVWHAGID